MEGNKCRQSTKTKFHETGNKFQIQDSKDTREIPTVRIDARKSIAFGIDRLTFFIFKMHFHNM